MAAAHPPHGKAAGIREKGIKISVLKMHCKTDISPPEKERKEERRKREERREKKRERRREREEREREKERLFACVRILCSRVRTSSY